MVPGKLSAEISSGSFLPYFPIHFSIQTPFSFTFLFSLSFVGWVFFFVCLFSCLPSWKMLQCLSLKDKLKNVKNGRKKHRKGEKREQRKKREEIHKKNFSSFFLLMIISAFNGWPAQNHMWTRKPSYKDSVKIFQEVRKTALFSPPHSKKMNRPSSCVNLLNSTMNMK